MKNKKWLYPEIKNNSDKRYLMILFSMISFSFLSVIFMICNNKSTLEGITTINLILLFIISYVLARLSLYFVENKKYKPY